MTDTRLTELLGIRHPLIQAPMAGIDTPKLAAAVSSEGALGSLGAGMLSPEKMREEIRAVRALREGARNVTLFAAQVEVDPGASIGRMQEHLAPWRERLGVAETPRPQPAPFGFEDQLAAVLEEKPEVFSFTFGLPPPEAMG